MRPRQPYTAIIEITTITRTFRSPAGCGHAHPQSERREGPFLLGTAQCRYEGNVPTTFAVALQHMDKMSHLAVITHQSSA